MTQGRVLRLSLDLNVLYADQKSRDRRVRGTAASMLVDAVRDGTCPAGPVQLVISVPVIENWADVLRRHFGFDAQAAREKAEILHACAADGPVPEGPRVVVGAGFVPFGTEREVEAEVRKHALPRNAGKLFDELMDDRHVLLAALAGEADILASGDDDLFTTPKDVIRFERDDVILHPAGKRPLVIAKPAFVAYWLRRGVVPDADFVNGNPGDFIRRAPDAAVAEEGAPEPP